MRRAYFMQIVQFVPHQSKIRNPPYKIGKLNAKNIIFKYQMDFFTDLKIICQMGARQTFLQKKTATGSWPENQEQNHLID